MGPGNNGGNALVALTCLCRRGIAVTAVPVRREADAARVWHTEGGPTLRRTGGSVAERVSTDADVVIDRNLGTGTRGLVALPDIAQILPPEAC